jgi:very-short-patch-repair endonuclease
VTSVERAKPSCLKDELAKAGKVRHAKTLRLLLNDLEGGAEALSEVAFLAFCRRHGFARPRLQARVDSQDRRRYLDAEFRCPDGRVFHVEVDGGVHLSLAVRWKDTRKDNDAALDGRLVLRFPSVAIYTDDADAVRQITRALQ